MGLFDVLFRSLSPFAKATARNGANEVHEDERHDCDPTGPDPVSIPDPSIRETIPVGPPPGVPDPGRYNPITDSTPEPLPQRYGTFLMVDMYPGEQGGKPKWHLLDQNDGKVGNCEIVGAILKATEGSSYRWHDWFIQQGGLLRKQWQGRLGRDRFMGAYHFLQVMGDGRKQAEYFVRIMEKIGMPQGGVDIHPMIDLEQGGQVNFVPKDCPKDKNGRADLTKLPDAKKREMTQRAIETTTKCAQRIKELTGFNAMLYGRGLMRDLGMTVQRGYKPEYLRMGCVGVWNPAWTATLPSMEAYGWPLDKVTLWQYGGGGRTAHPKLPRVIPGFGETDMNVYIDGPRKTSLDSLRKRLVLP